MADTLKDFLVGIGFKVDTTSQNRAEAAVRRTEAASTAATATESAKRVKTEQNEQDRRDRARRDADKKDRERHASALKEAQSFVLKLGAFAAKAAATVEASALGVVYAVDKAAKSYDRLNWMAQRTGAKAGSIGAFGYASSQLGSSAEDAHSSLEAFGQKLRLYGQGYGQALERLGVKTKDAKGQLRDTADIATDLGDALRRIQENGGSTGYTQAIVQAKMFGFEENQARALMNPEFRKREGQFKSDQAKIGANPDEAAKSGTAFEQSMRHLEEVLDHVGTKINGVLFERLKPLLDQLAAWFAANGDRVAGIVARVAEDLVKLATAIGEKIAGADWGKILDNVEALAKGFDKLLGKLGGGDGLIALMGLFGAALAIKVLKPLLGVVGAVRSLGLLTLPPWVAGLLGVGAGAALAEKVWTDPYGNPNAQKGTGIVGLRKHDQDRQEDAEGPWGTVKRAWRNRPGWLGGSGGDKPASSGGSPGVVGMRKEGGAGIAYDATSMTSGTGFSQGEYDAFRTGLTDIEGKRYDRMGGAGGRYAGRYQMGPAEITETAKRLGEPRPSNEQFLSDPKMQERFFENYTLDHHKQLMQHAAYAAMSNENKLKILGYAHNQGVGSRRRGTGAMGYLDTGRAGSDGWGTSGTAYFGPIGRRLAEMRKKPLTAAPPLPGLRITTGGAGLSPDKIRQTFDVGRPARPLGDTPALQSSISNSTRGDTNFSPTFNIHGTGSNTGPMMLEAARQSASRGFKDVLRNTQGAEQ